MVFWEKLFLSANLFDIFFLSLKWAEKNILLALCALQIIVSWKKNNVATTCREQSFCCAAKRKNIFRLRKKHSPPPPF